MTHLNWIALSTLTRREVMRFFRIWTQTLLPSPVSMVLYFVIFGGLIGPRIGVIDGYRYIEYIAPGLIMMAVINNAYANVVASFFGTKFQRNIEEMYVSPMSSWVIMLGFMIGGVARGCLVGLIVTCVALFFTKLHVHNMAVIFFSVLLTAMLFSLAGLINAIFSKKFDDISIIPTFVLTPLTYLGGVFYSMHMLSPFWQKLSHLNPILYMVNAFRYGMLGVSDVPVEISLIFIGACCVILYFWTWYLLEEGTAMKS
ncbi:ABC transporter permease [Candidatus Berkiella aquae]|uniref:Transport permease protein n=1 Tax=Candidatus Berkiella aquae TaxID=295108 RepID=A0A0Q9YXF3_9GAMM|nr:ABC transporter permease [Candidatus Berkiella aquae]